MRCVQDATVVPHKFRSSEPVETVDLDPPQNHSVLYADDQAVHLMHEETFEQMEVPLSAFGGRAAWLQDGMAVRVRSHGGAPLELTLPPRGAYEVAETLPGGRESKSDNAKPATLTNGVSGNAYAT
jgi:elongation factor P